MDPLEEEKDLDMDIPKTLSKKQKVEIVTDQLMEMLIMDLEYGNPTPTS